MSEKLIFVHAGCNKKFVNDAVCGRCGKEVPMDELLVLDVAMASSRGGGIRPAMPAEADYFGRIRQYPAAPSKDDEALQAKAHADYARGFEDRIAGAVAKALIAAQKKGAKA